MSVPDSQLEDDREMVEPCEGNVWTCHCSSCTQQWLDLEADRIYDERKERHP